MSLKLLRTNVVLMSAVVMLTACEVVKNKTKTEPCAVHYVVDTEAYSGSKPNIEGDSRQAYLAYWKLSDLTLLERAERGCKDLFHLTNGIVTVRQRGLYYIYGQVTYQTSMSQSGYYLTINNSRHLTKCAVDRLLGNATEKLVQTIPCFTASVVRLDSNQTVRVSNTVNYWRNIQTSGDATFWGICRL